MDAKEEENMHVGLAGNLQDEVSSLAQLLEARLMYMQSTQVSYLPRKKAQKDAQSVSLPHVKLQQMDETGLQIVKLLNGPQSKEEKLLHLQDKIIGNCKRCKLHSTRTNLVFGVGSPTARLVFVGEAPGEQEDKQGIPFVGRAGQLLTKMIEAMGLKRDDVYICNVVKSRPPENRNPEDDEVSACEPFLKAQLAIIKPEVIVTLGRYAGQCLLKSETPIAKLRGQWTSYEGIDLMPTFHPAYLLRNPPKKKEVWEDLQAVMLKMGLKPSSPL